MRRNKQRIRQKLSKIFRNVVLKTFKKVKRWTDPILSYKGKPTIDVGVVYAPYIPIEILKYPLYTW